jgi:molybdate transport system regulatory protein
MAKLRLRIDFEPAGSLGPGKVALLEAIQRCGSISSAARDMDMSYRRAWLLIDDLNQTFRQPVVSAVVGGRKGGGTGLTAFGESVIRHYRDMEAEAEASLAHHMAALQDEVVTAGSDAPPRECPIPEDGSERGEQDRDCDGRKAMHRSLSKQPAGRLN